MVALIRAELKTIHLMFSASTQQLPFEGLDDLDDASKKEHQPNPDEHQHSRCSGRG